MDCICTVKCVVKCIYFTKYINHFLYIFSTKMEKELIMFFKGQSDFFTLLLYSNQQLMTQADLDKLEAPNAEKQDGSDYLLIKIG